ncbi:MAG: DUF2851 family protein [Flavobacteriaceae bacterium]|nr:DUF2851 family protein [Flavobacteriaceae bacterium]
MKEKFLQKLWKNKTFNPLNFKDTEGNAIEILDFGVENSNAGPDFHSAKIKTQNLTFFGNIEIHRKSSEWYLHKHHQQENYQSIILHLVFEHDQDIAELKAKNIPTIELKKYLPPHITLDNFSPNSDFIPCEEIFDIEKIPDYFLRELIFQKLEEKDKEMKQLLASTKNDYEAILFQKIAYAFGLKINADIFLQIAQNIDFKIIKKISQNHFQLESLFFGKADLLQEHLSDAQKWKKEYDFLKVKFQLNDIHFPAKYLRLMPVSFPTIRLSQLANLYFQHQNLFSKIINAQNLNELKTLFKEVKTSEYWENHYTFDKESETKTKRLSSDFIDILILNAILPVIYSYHKNQPNILDKILNFYKEIKPEKNAIIKQWKNLGAEIHSALDSQAFLYLYKNFCQNKKCIHCHQINNL